MTKQAQNDNGIDQTDLYINVSKLEEAEHALTLSIIKDVKSLERAEGNVTAKVIWQVMRHCKAYPRDTASALFPLTGDNQLRKLEDDDWQTIMYLMFRMYKTKAGEMRSEFDETDGDETKSVNVYIKRIKDVISSNRMLIARILHHDDWGDSIKWSKDTIIMRYKLFGNVVRVDDLVASLSDQEVDDEMKAQNKGDLDKWHYLTARTDPSKNTYSWARAQEWAEAWHKTRWPKTRGSEESTEAPKLTTVGKDVRTAIEAMSTQGMEFDKQSPTAKADNVQTFVALGKFLGVFTIDDTGKASINADKLSSIVATYNEAATKAAKAESKTDAQRLADSKANLWKFDTSDVSLSKQIAYMVKTFKLDDQQAEALRASTMGERSDRELVQQLDEGLVSAKEFRERFDGDAKEVETRRAQYLFLEAGNKQRDLQAELRTGAHKPGSDMFKGCLKALSYTTMTRAQLDELAKIATDAYSARTKGTKAA